LNAAGHGKRTLLFAICLSLADLLFALGFPSKPMVATLPFVLPLLDYWPLAPMPTWMKPACYMFRFRGGDGEPLSAPSCRVACHRVGCFGRADRNCPYSILPLEKQRFALDAHAGLHHRK